MMPSGKNVLVIGGAGYIGSHLCKACAHSGFTPITYDSLLSGHKWAVKWGPLVQKDLLDTSSLLETLKTYQPIAVYHLASLINARESVQDPSSYYQNNVIGTFHLLEALKEYHVPYLVFSSSAAVYGNPSYHPIDEQHPLKPIHPYGKSKLICEYMIEDFSLAYGMNYAILRYFNAAGADPDQEIGESHHPETHLLPSIIEVLQKRRSHLSLYGKEHPTPDGTAIRDYIHVSDLASAHIKALEWIQTHRTNLTLNLGTGTGYSIGEILKTFESYAKQTVPIEILPQQQEPASLVADATKAQQVLNWQPRYSSLDQLIQTAWSWHHR